MTTAIPALRVRTIGDAEVAPSGRYVLYWMSAHRRVRYNFALQHACFWAKRLGKPLLVLEALRLGYPWASQRLHRFVIEGMADNAERLSEAGVTYFPYVEDELDAGKGLLAALAERACLVIGDDYPAFFIPRMLAAAGRALPVRLEVVDANGIVPLRASDKAFTTAHSFRRWFQKHGPDHLLAGPQAEPLTKLPKDLRRTVRLPAGVGERWPKRQAKALGGKGLDALLDGLAFEHEVPAAPARGGAAAGEAQMESFLDERLDRYADGRNHPDDDVSSGLSPWLHFGHLGAHELVHAVLEREAWSPDRLGDPRQTRGSREGWWGLSAAAESFLDEAVIWREIGQLFCWHHPEDYMRYASLPSWARETLEDHLDDPRPERYELDELEAARTGDEIWNAAQRQLIEEGRIHNYLRMLWGKKILEWSDDPRQAIERMIHLNDKYALDGRDPNSYSGIFWVCGRFDRAWGPERPIYGKIRYMSSDSTRRKLSISDYLERWSGQGRLL
ncbi:deoxyribodipyrimidine photolyase [Pseudenhygromyxa sp. WMMC2535]|uniref:FAD-binding domain-containing protein n=1 Tax=Pseudenhygromyxa sp. WMMC2535 TaxID=2712867 RepID=UPI001551655C|nr:FAD-binding domain-containing protein [Pseudenhygromyxa sp. WMMC2535]NVB42314.1 deoxyribodipyrimidine photolyase [Pseudenhygromyxa sp. WMMC2535]